MVEIQLSENDTVIANKIHSKIPVKAILLIVVILLVALIIGVAIRDWGLVGGAIGGFRVAVSPMVGAPARVSLISHSCSPSAA